MQEVKLIKKKNKIFEEDEEGLRKLYGTIMATEPDDTGYTVKPAGWGERRTFVPKNWIDREER
jgi:hypothetical protein